MSNDNLDNKIPWKGIIIFFIIFMLILVFTSYLQSESLTENGAYMVCTITSTSPLEYQFYAEGESYTKEFFVPLLEEYKPTAVGQKYIGVYEKGSPGLNTILLDKPITTSADTLNLKEREIDVESVKKSMELF